MSYYISNCFRLMYRAHFFELTHLSAYLQAGAWSESAGWHLQACNERKCHWCWLWSLIIVHVSPSSIELWNIWLTGFSAGLWLGSVCNTRIFLEFGKRSPLSCFTSVLPLCFAALISLYFLVSFASCCFCFWLVVFPSKLQQSLWYVREKKNTPVAFVIRLN